MITEISQGAPINNPWSGERTASAAPVHIPLNTMSSGNGEDLEIKIEWTNDDGTISKRFYKGWLLNEVFDYTRTSNGTTHYVYAKFSEDGEWYKYNQHSGSSSEGAWEWSFSSPSGSQQTISKTTFERGGMSSVIHFRNVGFLLHDRRHVSGYNGEEAADIYSGQDENYTTYYDAYQGWSSVRVYYKKTRSTFTRFYKGWHLNEVFNYKAINAISSNTIREEFMRDIKHSFFFDAEHTYHDQTGNSKLTLHNSPSIYSEGLNLIKSETQYATLNGTTIGGTLTFAMWYNMHSESGSNFPRLFQY